MTATNQTPLIFDQVEYLAQSHDEALLKTLGFETDLNGNVKCNCPIHSGDNPTAFSYSSELKMWKCWTRKCHEEYSTTLVGLVKAVKKFNSNEEAYQYILEVCGNGFIPDENVLKLQRYIKTHIRNSKIENPVLDEEFLKKLPKVTDGLPDRGLLAQTCIDFNLRQTGDINHILKNRIIFPILDEDNKFVGVSGRTTNDNKSKWYHYPPSLRIGKLLWPLLQFKEYCYNQGTKRKTAILVEGPFDAAKLHQLGYNNTVCLFGTNCSNDQIKILLKYRVTDIILFLDPDGAGQEALEGMRSKLSLYFDVKVVEGHNKDPDEMTKEELDRCLK